MPFVVVENCIRCKYTDCVEVCPVDCFHEGPNFLVRIENTAGQSRVSAINASGIVLRAGPASILLDQLRAKL